MPPDPPHSLVDLSNLSKPADTLIEKLSDVIGGLYEPRQIRKIAQAKADAALIEAKPRIEITELERRAMHRFVEEEARHQQNMENIVAKTIPEIKEEAGRLNGTTESAGRRVGSGGRA